MKLEVGAVIYGTHRYRGMQRLVIERVTPTMAMARLNESAEIKFCREVGDGCSFYAKGSQDRWDKTSYKIETPTLASVYNRYLLRRRFEEIDAESLTEGQFERILAIVSEVEKK